LNELLLPRKIYGFMLNQGHHDLHHDQALALDVIGIMGCLGFKLTLSVRIFNLPFGQVLIGTIFILVAQGVREGAWGHVDM
jgi:hypothetical protein